jgi:hypothetical protein
MTRTIIVRLYEHPKHWHFMREIRCVCQPEANIDLQKLALALGVSRCAVRPQAVPGIPC